MKVLAPKDENELGRMLKTALSLEGPVALRYPRGEGLGAALEEPFTPLESLAAEVLEEEGEIAILAVGSMVDAARKTAKLLKEEELSAAVVNMRTVKPLDEELLHRMAHEKKMLVTMEENALAGGFGSAVLEALADAGLLVPVVRFGIGDAFIEQGKPQELLEMAGLLPEQMARSILTAWKGARDGEGAA